MLNKRNKVIQQNVLVVLKFYIFTYKHQTHPKILVLVQSGWINSASCCTRRYCAEYKYTIQYNLHHNLLTGVHYFRKVTVMQHEMIAHCMMDLLMSLLYDILVVVRYYLRQQITHRNLCYTVEYSLIP